MDVKTSKKYKSNQSTKRHLKHTHTYTLTYTSKFYMKSKRGICYVEKHNLNKNHKTVLLKKKIKNYFN